MQVLLVRHGESEANHRNMIVSQQGDPALTEHGWREARETAKHWELHPIQAVYSSPLLRTRQTASAFLKKGMEVIVDDRLHEIALGRWDGMTIEAIEAADHERYHQWKQDPEMGAPDGGEALSRVAERIQSFLSDVRRQYHEGLIIAATHSDCMKAAMLSTLDAPWTSAQWFHLTNTAGLLLEWRDQHWQIMAQPLAPLK